MKTMTMTRYGGPEVFGLEHRPRPVPKSGEVLVRVHASSVNYGDLVARDFGHLKSRQFNMPWLLWFLAKAAFGFRKPKITVLGSEFSGTVEEVGPEVTTFHRGDSVFGYTAAALGAYAEFVCLPASGMLTEKPSNVSYAEAGTVAYGATTALALLRPMALRAGQSLLIVGASGAIGSAAVQLAKSWGVTVTGVCGPKRQDYVRSLGADTVLDYSRGDYTAGSAKYDVVLDILGKGRFSKIKRILNPGGRYLLASFKSKKLGQMLWTSWFGDKKVLCALAPSNPEDLKAIANLMAAGQFRARVDKSFPLEQVAEAHRYVEAGERQGTVAIALTSGVGE